MKGLRRRGVSGTSSKTRELGFALLLLPWVVYLGLNYFSSNGDADETSLARRSAVNVQSPLQNEAIYFDGHAFHGPQTNLNPMVPTGEPQMKVEVRGNYTVVVNFAMAKMRFGYDEAVTLTTHATPELLKHVKPLANHWDGPISVAVFVPADDFATSVDEIGRLRICSLEVLHKATFHLFFPTMHPPTAETTFNFTDLEEKCPDSVKPLEASYRQKKSMAYPINVARNLARTNAMTERVLASDVELYPSQGAMGAFLRFAAEDQVAREDGKVVYVLPIFEVEAGEEPPANKTQLVDMYRRKKAVFFHKYVCSFCNAIPKLNKWLTSKPKPTSEVGIFLTIKRHKPFNRWEPIYIGTHREPLFDERLTWEGQQDKMSQMYELCLLDYDLAILDNAFLVHAPGIKKRNETVYKVRAPYIKQNNKIYSSILANLHHKYGKNKSCN